jgi:hypothetical protein
MAENSASLSQADAKKVKCRIRVAEEYAKKHFQKAADRAQKLYDGEHYEDIGKPSSEPRVIVNYIWPMVETLVQSVAFNYPEFTLVPLNQEGAAAEPIAAQAIRHEWRQSKAQRECKRALRDSKITNLGVVYTGWLFETEGPKPVRMESGRMPVEGEEQDQTPDLMSAEPAVDQLAVREDRFLVKRISPKCFLIAPECDSVLENAAYCGHWELWPLEKVKADKRFKNTRQIKGNSKNLKEYFGKAAGESEPLSTGDEKADMLRVQLYHYWERDRRIHAVFCDEHDQPLLVEKWTWKADRYPYRVLRGPGDEDDFFDTPPPLRVEHPQQEINESRTQLSVQRKISNPGYQAVGWSPDQKSKRQMRSGHANRIIEVEKPLELLPRAQVQPEVYQSATQAVQDIQFIGGLNEYQTATPPTKRVTTSEVEAIQQAGGARSSADRQAFEMFCAEVAEDLLAWLQQYSVRTRTLPIYDESGSVTDFKDYSSRDIQGQFSIEVYVGSTSAPNEQDKVKNTGFLLQSLQPFAEAYQIDLRPLLRDLLRSIPGIRNVEEIVPEPQPMMPGMAPPGMEGQEPPMDDEMLNQLAMMMMNGGQGAIG